MKNIARYLIAGLLTLMIGGLSTACGTTLTAQQIFERTSTAAKNITSVSYDMTLQFSIGGLSLEMDGSGYTEPPDKAYLTMGWDLLGESMNIEILGLNSNEFYMRTSDSPEWISSTAEDVSGLTNFDSLFLGSSAGSEGQFPEDLTNEGVERINDVPCHKLTMSLDLSQFLGLLLASLGESSDVQMRSGTASITLYTAVNTFLPQQIQFEMTFDIDMSDQSIPMTISGLITYHDYDQIVQLPSPH